MVSILYMVSTQKCAYLFLFHVSGVVQDITTSDHKPVFSSFTVGILPQNISRNVHSITTPIIITLYDISCEVSDAPHMQCVSIFIVRNCLLEFNASL